MKERILGMKLKKEFALKRKDSGIDFGRLFIVNSITLPMRVKIYILKSVAKKFETKKEIMFLTGFTSWQVLQVKLREGSMAFTFMDAIGGFRKGMRVADLEGAYCRTRGLLMVSSRENFDVLLDGIVAGELRSVGPVPQRQQNKKPLLP